jgi:hypothetical protein
MVHLARSGWLHPVRERQKYYPPITKKRFNGTGCVSPVMLVAEKLHAVTRQRSGEERMNALEYESIGTPFHSNNNSFSNGMPQKIKNIFISVIMVA